MEEIPKAQFPKAEKIRKVSKKVFSLLKDWSIHPEIHIKPLQAMLQGKCKKPRI